LLVVEGRFCWVFEEKGVVDAVFLWSGCGETCGEDGLLMVGFGGSQNRHFFYFIFGVAR
jgi:hypothetical protein